MAKRKTRLLSILLAAVMILGLLPLSVFAESEEETAETTQYSDFLSSLTVLEGYADACY